jgi:hypothetical protein
LFLRGAASSTYPRVTTNPSWPTDPLEYIVVERETKYGGEMLIWFTILHDFQWTHLSLVQICYEWRQWIKILGLLEKHSHNNQSEVMVHTSQEGNYSNYCLFVMLHFTNDVTGSRQDNITLNYK